MQRIPRKKLYIVFFLFSLLVVFILFPKENLCNNIWREFNFQFVFAFLTAVFTTIIFYSYDYLKNYFKLRRFVGYWQVCKFKNESYAITDEYVELERASDETLYYTQINVKSLNAIKGTLFINRSNKKTGKLISSYELANLVETLYPISEKLIYFELNRNNFPNPETVIRVMDLKGNELFILIKAKNQKSFYEQIVKEQSETMFNMGNTIPNLSSFVDLKPNR